jgi:hypothetical protein
MCCPKGKCGCQYFILLTLKKKLGPFLLLSLTDDIEQDNELTNIPYHKHHEQDCGYHQTHDNFKFLSVLET